MWKEFISEVETGKLVTGELIKLAVKRHKKNIRDSKKKDYPYYFDEDEANRCINYAKRHRHTKGEYAGKLFDLQPEQAFAIASVFGWRHKETGYRRFTKVFRSKARKGGKTEEAALICSIGLLADREPGAEVYTAATKRDQAKICFSSANIMLKNLAKEYPSISEKLTFHKINISTKDSGSKLEPLSSDSDKQDGLSPSVAILDEYHAHKTSELLEVIETGMGARRQPLLYIITTAGFNKASPCYKFRKVCIDILKGIKEDESVFVMIFELDEEDDWKDESVWVKANPNIGKAPYWHYMRGQFLKAQNEGSTKEVQFKTKNLNMWVGSSDTWIKDEDIIKNVREYTEESLEGKECFVALDLASVKDITALVLLFPLEDGSFKTLYYLFCPEKTIRDSLDMYYKWNKEGYIIQTPGNVTDYDFVKAKILELLERFNFRRFYYDRWNSSQLVIDLVAEGVNMLPVGQGFVSLSAATKDIEKLKLQGKLFYNGSPVVRWMFSNVEIKRDPAGNVKPDKGNSEGKIDGVVALVMAYKAWLDREDIKEAYSSHGLRFV